MVVRLEKLVGCQETGLIIENRRDRLIGLAFRPLLKVFIHLRCSNDALTKAMNEATIPVYFSMFIHFLR